MSAIRHRLQPRHPHSQRGASIITAIFLITALAVLAALMTKMTIMSSTEIMSDWYSAQALYAAESGVDWGAHRIVNTLAVPAGCPAVASPDTSTGHVVSSGHSWFDVSITWSTVDSMCLYTITSSGMAGGSTSAPAAQRQLQILFTP